MTYFQDQNDDQNDPRFRVLLVDDNAMVRDCLYTMLEGAGYEVLAASNGWEALAIFRRSIPRIELLVTDYNMPGMSGLELARECALLHPEVSVLYVSGAQPDAELQADLEAPNRGFIAKPFRAAELVRKTRELLLTEAAGQLSLSR